MVKDITHVAIAFMRPLVFNQEKPESWPLWTNVKDVRTKFSKDAAVMVAIGGWGDTAGFSEAARTDESRKLFAKNIKAMIDDTGADGTKYTIT